MSFLLGFRNRIEWINQLAAWFRSLGPPAFGGLLLGTVAGGNPVVALTITPLFDGSITGAANAAAVEAAISNAIGGINSLYSNAGTVGIVFTQTSGSFLGQSQTADYNLGYTTYVSDLTAVSHREASNAVLASAVANLASGNKPSSGGSVVLTSADARVALGLAGATGCFAASGSFVAGCRQSYDGVVTLTTSFSLNYGTTAVAGAYSAINAVEHEIDEILGGGGQGSVLNAIASGNSADSSDVGVLDLYRYAARGVASFSTSGGSSSYFSVDGGATAIVAFNQSSTGGLRGLQHQQQYSVGVQQRRRCPAVQCDLSGVRDAGGDWIQRCGAGTGVADGARHWDRGAKGDATAGSSGRVAKVRRGQARGP